MSTRSSDGDLEPLFEAAAPDHGLARHRRELLRRLLGPREDTEPTIRSEHFATPGSWIGRYVVIEVLGHGGMGVVLRAYDPKLQREVALKAVHSGPLSAHGGARMLREARAMARLSHPNVVALYDAELDAECGVVVAMELVPGQTLQHWLEDAPRWRDVLEKFIAAGRGLAAAHAAGVLHRDFKPANVLVGDDGRTRVTDFGLAWTLERSSPDLPTPPSMHGDETTPIDALTNDRGVLGTPAYMAPEQHEGRRASPATDQYAFCVALWEGLTGTRPFVGTRAELAAAKRRGPPPWPRGAHVPRSICEAVVRGLGPDPAQRWPSMNALLATLSQDRRRKGRRLAWIGGASLTLTLGTVALAGWIRHETRCSGAEAALADAWSPAHRQAIESALRDTGLPFAPAVRSRTLARLDAYAERWIAGHREACEATSVRAEQSAAIMDLRMACLHRARVDLSAAVHILADADARVLERAHDLVDDLPLLDGCDDVAALQTGETEPAPAQREAVATIRDGVAEARALRHVARVDDALALAEIQWRAAEQLDYDPLVTEAALELAAAQRAAGAFEPAEASYRRALRAALRGSQPARIVTAASGLLLVVGIERARPEEAMLLADVARGAADRTGDPVHDAELRDAIGIVLRALGRFTEAEAEHRSAISAWERTLGPDAPAVAKSRTNLGLALGRQARYSEAEAEHRAAVAILERTLGATHPDVAKSRNNLAIALQRMGLHDAAVVEYDGAIEAARAALGERHPLIAKVRSNLGGALLERGEPHRAAEELRQALTILEAAYGPDHTAVAAARQSLGVALDNAAEYAAAIEELREAVAIFQAALGAAHPDVAYARGALGIALHRRGDYAAAEAELRAAVAATELALGPEHTDAGDTRTNLGLVLHEVGRYAEAEVEFEQALAIFERALGRDHPDVGMTLHNLGLTQQQRGDFATAERRLRRALAIREASLGREHPDVASTALALGELLLEQRRLPEASVHLERAHALSQRADAYPEVAADAAFALARRLWHHDRERTRSRDLAREARRRFIALGDAEQAQVDRVDAWLRSHG